MEIQNPPAKSSSSHSWKKDVAAAVFVVLVSSAIFAAATKQWLYSSDVPRAYSNDYLIYLTWVETMIEEGSYLHNTRMGMPLGTDWRGFPTSDGWLNWQVIRGLALIKPDPVWVMNWFYWLTFPMVGLSAFIVLRLLGIGRITAIATALLYDFVPYHVFRDEHVFMTAFYLVPWSIYACMFWRGSNPEVGGRNLTTLYFFLLAIITGAGYIYYAYFACLLMMGAGIYRSVNDRDTKPLMYSVFWCGLVVSTLFLTLLPEIRFKLSTIPNPDTTIRLPSEVEVYGFKLPQLVLPTMNHQLERFAGFRTYYQTITPLINENESAALGAIGSVGLLVILFRCFFRKASVGETRNHLPAVLGTLAVLIGLAGGLSAVINWVQYFFGINPWIRSCNRISLYVSFFSLLALAEIVDRWQKQIQSSAMNIGFVAGLAIITALGIADQTPRKLTDKYEENAAMFHSDKEFFTKLDGMGKRGDLLFILGYRFYPECSIDPLCDYSLCRPYLHTKSKTFNYGALRGDVNDIWSRELSARPAAEIVDRLARIEAMGILIYRPSYHDQGKAIESQTRSVLGFDPEVSPDGQFAFFKLETHTAKLKKESTPDTWAQEKRRLTHPLTPIWRGNFHKDDFVLGMRTFARGAQIRIENRLDFTRQMRMNFTVAPDAPESPNAPRWLKIEHGDKSEIVEIPTTGKVIDLVYQVAPGGIVLTLTPSMTRESLEAGSSIPGGSYLKFDKAGWSETLGK